MCTLMKLGCNWQKIGHKSKCRKDSESTFYKQGVTKMSGHTPHPQSPLTIYFCDSENCQPRHFYGPAVRPHYLLHVILRGRGIYQHRGITYTLSQGDAFLITPIEITYYQADETDASLRQIRSAADDTARRNSVSRLAASLHSKIDALCRLFVLFRSFLCVFLVFTVFFSLLLVELYNIFYLFTIVHAKKTLQIYHALCNPFRYPIGRR